ncbi:MAG TPA: hypothetical protein VFI61_04040 [Patescibacteria group bacterium]|nr:hypothetical protein [Patescibacteria group bacterium]
MSLSVDMSEEVRENEYHDARMRIDPWIKELNDKGLVGEIDLNLGDLQNIFEFKCKAKYEISPESKKSLSEYMPGEASDGMEAVWGDTILDEFDAFKARWIADYNAKKGNRRLPRNPSGEMGTGIKRFFLELTQLSAGVLDLETFTDRTENALMNGKLYQAELDGQRIKRRTPKSKDAIRVAELPPGFVSDFYEWLLNSKP